MPYVDKWGNAWDGLRWLPGKRPVEERWEGPSPPQPSLDTVASSHVVRDEATDASQLAVGPHPLAVFGNTIAAAGFPPITQGMDCRLDFTESHVSIMAIVYRGLGYQPVAEVSYEATRYLRIGGPGAITSSRGGGWMGGGFGVQGIVEGALIASALNALTRRTKTTIETLIELNAGPRALVLLNNTQTPKVLETRLAPVFARLDDLKHEPATAATAQRGSSNERLAQLKQLGELRASGVLTDEEFLAEKRKLLGT